MLTFFYQLLLHLYALASLPKFLWQRKGRPLGTWFGKSFPQLGPKRALRVWIHAVSVGEAKAVGPLIQRVRKAHPDCEIILSSITATGHAEVKRSLPEVDHPIYLPLDLTYIIRPLVQQLDPDLFLLCETDYWLTLLEAIKKQGAKVYVINGKLSARSARRYKRLTPFTRRLFRAVDHFCLQDGAYAKRFAALGVSAERITVTGNLKYESAPKRLGAAELKTLSQQLKLSGPVFTVGSTHPGEEALLLPPLMNRGKILLVPRHPHRFDEVAQFLTGEGILYGRYSAREQLTGREQVILVDAMGILASCYQLADLSVVGGSFVPRIGGHNILEPLWCDSPCLFGPHMDDQPGMVDLVHAHRAGLQIAPGELQDAVVEVLGGRGEELVAAGKQVLAAIEGATRKTFETLLLEPKSGVR